MTDTTTPAKHPGGRPTKYRPEMCEQVIDLAQEGYSLTAIAGFLHTGRNDLADWGQKHAEFGSALSRVQGYRGQWWERQARRVAKEGGPGGQTMMIIFALKNLNSPDWKDRVEHTGADGGPINLEALLLRAEEKREERLIKTIEHEPAKRDQQLSAPKPGNEQSAQ
jgi:transposase